MDKLKIYLIGIWITFITRWLILPFIIPAGKMLQLELAGIAFYVGLIFLISIIGFLLLLIYDMFRIYGLKPFLVFVFVQLAFLPTLPIFLPYAMFFYLIRQSYFMYKKPNYYANYLTEKNLAQINTDLYMQHQSRNLILLWLGFMLGILLFVITGLSGFIESTDGMLQRYEEGKILSYLAIFSIGVIATLANFYIFFNVAKKYTYYLIIVLLVILLAYKPVGISLFYLTAFIYLFIETINKFRKSI